MLSVRGGTKLEAQHSEASNVVIKVKSARSTAQPATNVDAPGNSGIRLSQSNSGSPQSQPAAGPQDEHTPNSTSESSKKEGLSEIVVTGTHIQGAAPAGSSLTTYTRHDIHKSRAAPVHTFSRQMVENFPDTHSLAD